LLSHYCVASLSFDLEQNFRRRSKTGPPRREGHSLQLCNGAFGAFVSSESKLTGLAMANPRQMKPPDN